MQIALGSWSLRDHINNDFPFYEFPAFAKNQFGIDIVELSQLHFARYDASYLQKMKESLVANDVQVVNIPVDIGDVSNHNLSQWKHDLKVLKLWINIASFLECPCMRVNTGEKGDTEIGFKRVVQAFNVLARYGEEKGVTILLENHGGISSDPEKIKELFSLVNSSNFRACPDFGNFADDLRFEGLEILTRYTHLLVHAKTYDFEEDGSFKDYDFGRCLQILKNNNFDKILSIEFEGKGNQIEGVKQTVELINKLW